MQRVLDTTPDALLCDGYKTKEEVMKVYTKWSGQCPFNSCYPDRYFQLTAQHPSPCRDICPFPFTVRHAGWGREIFLMYKWYGEKRKISMWGNYLGDVFWGAESLCQLMPSSRCCRSLLQCAGGVLVSRWCVRTAGCHTAGHFLFSSLQAAIQ